MAKSKGNSKIDKQCIYWLPCMAQDNLRVLQEGSLYMQYIAQGKSAFYHIHSQILKSTDESQSTANADYRGLKIKVRITVYQKIDNNRSLLSSNSQSIERTIEKISKEKFEYFADETIPSDLTKKSIKREHSKNENDKRKTKKNPDELIVILTLQDYLPSGLASFSIKLKKYASFYEKIKDILYYHIKLHFHQHHYHDKMDKTAKALYIPPQKNEIILQENDNEGLLYYIEKFHEIITREIDTLYQDYKSIDIPNKHKKKSERISKKQAEKMKSKFYDSCYNLIGLSVFVQSLINCVQNKACRLNNPESKLTESKKKKFQNIASNLINSKAGVDVLRSKTKHHHEDDNLRKANIISYISLGLGIISIILATLSFEFVRNPIYSIIHKEDIITNSDKESVPNNNEPLSTQQIRDQDTVTNKKTEMKDIRYQESNGYPKSFSLDKEFSAR